ncbi:zinc finger, PHD-type containing protein [Tanacetum coccineum]|uniref:Zinc finger, PHD-type containing protein n=1 Tax=Tanacetum coccineum TaxID=301880 RepID=A0ABQ4YNZ8_9ASTR
MLPKFSQIVNRLYAFIYETNHSKSGLGLPSIVALVMVIDKSWTLLERHEKAFYTGLTKFVDDCKPLVNSAGNIKCPCKSCRTVLWVSIKNLPKHITRYGWDPGYKTWVHHGEPDLPPLPPVIDNTRQPQMSDMIALLNDLSYIPPNNEQNEPIQEDIGETSNEPTQAKRNEFEELYASANEELYPGCDYVTRLDFMAKFTYFKVKGKLTDSIFNEILEFFQHVFPTTKGYKLPPSYYAIKKTFKTIGLGYESIHACVNDCFLFRGDNNKDLHFCPVCKTSRWKDSNTPGKKVPKKVLRYFPIIPRLQRLYKSSHTAKEMTWHATGKCTEPGKMQHPVDGRAWKNFDTKYPNFAKEPRNVRLGLAADGFNPFGNLSQAYSMWPVILTTYNLPPWLCMKESSFMLTLLIPGPKSPGKDIDVYLRPLIDDLKVLWALKGVETIDVATGQKFNMRAMVLWTINDFPARSSLSGWSGQGYKACPTCNEDTPSVRVLGKTAYVGHRRFLKKPHKWRRSLEFNGEIEDKDPPRKFDRDQIQAQLARLPTRVKGKHPSYGGVKIKRNVLVELNWTKRSIFYELEYWSFLTLKHNLDIMHIEKNVLEAILNTLLMNDKSKDTAKARQDLKKLGIRSGLWLGQTKNGKCSKPQAAYSFSPENRKKFCQFIKGVKLPDGFGSNFKHKVTDNDTNITGLKSHDCHIMMQRLLPYGLQQYLPDEVAKPIIELCSFFKQICSATLMEDDMLKAQSKVVDILCNLELIYPPAFFDIMIHLVIHLPLEALEGGPIRPRWMFPFERFMKKLKGYVRNKAKPEGSIAEGYVAEEALTFSSHYFRDVTTKFNRPDRNVDPPPPTCQFQVFRSLCKSIGLRSVIRFDAQELKKVIWYVLHNSPEIDTYRSQFKSKFPNKDMKEEIPDSFGSHIRQRHVDNDPGVSATSELFTLACGPTPTLISVNSYVVNGMRFVVHSRDERHLRTPLLPHDLADSNDEDLANDDDDVAVVYSSKEED